MRWSTALVHLIKSRLSPMAATLVAAIGIITSHSALAHPHVWIDASAEFIFEDDKITGLHMHWLFDDLFSMALMDEFDQNRDTRFFDEENTAIRDNAFSALRDVSWLTHLRSHGDLVTFSGAKDFVADVTNDRRVSYDFVLTLDTPLDPIKGDVTLSVYDAEYYIDVAFTQDDPILFSGNKHLSCFYEMSEDEEHRIYFDLVAPIRADLVCSKKVADGGAGGLAPGDFVRVD
ncbi:DUF1007 family protein [Thalassospira sp. MA62]|nr:DUF1007 family protein [Thalassospira sp. MA62]